MTKKTKFYLIIYLILLAIGAFFSWGLVVPNLIFNQSEIWLNWQWWQWDLWNENRHLMAISFLIWIITIFSAYIALLSCFWNKKKSAQTSGAIFYQSIAQSDKKSPPKKNTDIPLQKSQKLATQLPSTPKITFNSQTWPPQLRQIIICLLLLILPLLFAYNALSADVFNYIFNAKMITVYQANPHQIPANTFVDDPLIKFMHNSHTAAPYGYVWTALSLPFYLISFSKFTLAWCCFKLAAVTSLGLTVGLVIWLFAKIRSFQTDTWLLAALFFNPLFLIEIIMNSHNDLWMMAGTLASLGLMILYRQKRQPHFGEQTSLSSSPSFSLILPLTSALCLALSVGIKYASLVALPFWLYLLCGPEIITALRKRWLSSFFFWFEKYFFDFLALAFFLLLLLPRAQFFHPWYLLWALVWLPFCRWRWTRVALLAFSVSSLLRYFPWLWTGNYEGSVLFYQKLFTWAGATIIFFMVFIREKLLKYFYARS